MRRRIGILGGTFNPVHTGHLILAQDAQEIFKLSKVLFVPCEKPPHKNAGCVISAVHRVAMLKSALKGNNNFEICDLEIQRGGTSYSVDTVFELKKLYPNYEFFFLIGSDTLFELYQWKEIDKLLARCHFQVFTRPGFNLHTVDTKEFKLDLRQTRDLLQNIATAHQVNISSSDIRDRIAEGKSIRYLVPQAVEEYITKYRLYSKEKPL